MKILRDIMCKATKKNCVIILLTSVAFFLVFYIPLECVSRRLLGPSRPDRHVTWNFLDSDNSLDHDNYLLPINFILSRRHLYGNDKDFIQNALIQKQNLDPYLSFERGWIENGIMYRLFQKQKHVHLNSSKAKSPYKGEFEEYIAFDEERFFRGRKPDTMKADISQKKIILWYTKTRYQPPMPGLTPLRVCPEFPCAITSNKAFINKSHALIFAAQLLEPTPPPRRQDQIFIFHNHESPRGVPVGYMRTPQWRGAFNWTMTFRMDSDIPALYGIVRRRPTNRHRNYTQIVANKTNPVAWLVSHCNTRSNRDIYAQELNKHIPVDIYGNCGTLTCGKRYDDNLCIDLFSKKYKFYLAFESSFCQDYITEKLFKYFNLDLIVVTRGSNEYYRHLPSDIFINADNFATPGELAERLKFLDTNDTEYIDMLRKKDKYFSVMQDYPILNKNGKIKYMAYRKEETSLCHVCYRLWNMDRYSKLIPDVFQWFDKGKCKARAPV